MNYEIAKGDLTTAMCEYSYGDTFFCTFVKFLQGRLVRGRSRTASVNVDSPTIGPYATSTWRCKINVANGPYIITYIWALSMGKQDHPFQGTVLLSDWFQLHTHRRREFSAQESNSNRQCRKLRLGDDPTSFNPCMQMQN